MGLHTGELTGEPAVGAEGYLGVDVVRAARLSEMGRGGHVLLSEATRALLGSGLPEGVSVSPLGEKQLKDIDEPERIYELAIEGVERFGEFFTATDSEVRTGRAYPASQAPLTPPTMRVSRSQRAKSNAKRRGRNRTACAPTGSRAPSIGSAASSWPMRSEMPEVPCLVTKRVRR